MNVNFSQNFFIKKIKKNFKNISIFLKFDIRYFFIYIYFIEKKV